MATEAIEVLDDAPIPVDLEQAQDVDENGDELETPLIYDENAPNLCEAFMGSEKGREWLKKACTQVHGDWEREWNASEAYRRRFAEDMKIFAGDLPPLKDPPYSFCANANVPIMLENMTRLVLRASGELFGSWDDVYAVVPLNKDDTVLAEAMTKHGNWQIRNQIPNFKNEIAHRGLFAFFLAGAVTCRSYYDTRTKLNCHEIMTPDDFVLPFSYSGTKPDLSDCPWYAYKLVRHRHELEAEEGWYGVSDLLAGRQPLYSDEPDAPAAESMMRVVGKDIDDSSKSAPYKLICWEGWMSIPPSEDSGDSGLPLTSDGDELDPRQRFLRIIIDFETKNPLLVAVHEAANWQEKERFRIQTAEMDAYRAARTQHEMMVTQHQENVAGKSMELDMAEQQGALGPEQAFAAREQLIALQQMPMPPAPEPPGWLINPDDPYAGPELPRKDPIRLITHAVCIESLVGNIGLSYGRILSDINRGANIVFNQFIDSATLANIKSILVAGGASELGDMKLKPGQIQFLKSLPGSVKDSLIQLEFPPANPQMIEILKLLMQFGQESVQSPNILSGQPGKSGETYRGVAARIEQATKQLSVLTGKYRDFLENVLKKNALLNSMFLREEEIHLINNELLGFAEEVRVGRAMYERNYIVEIRADLRFAPQTQRVAEADELVQMSMSIPVLMQNPDFQYHAVVKSLRARGHYDMIRVLGPSPSQKLAQMNQQRAAQGLPPLPMMPMAPPQGAPGQGGPPKPKKKGPPQAAE